jgi:hypothetical protein
MSKTFFGRLIALIGSIFAHVLKGAEKTFNELTPEQQAALKHGSGVTALISQEAGKLPAEVHADILKTFPDLDEASLETGLFTVAHAFNLAPKANDLDDCIALLQAYLSTLTGSVWEAITQGVAGVLSVIFSPTGTRFAAVGQLLEYVYETFFQKKK